MANYSYVTYLTDDTYIYGIMLLKESLNQVDSKYPLYALVTENVSQSVLEILNQINVEYQVIEKISLPDKIFKHNISIKKDLAYTWKDCLTQLQVFNLTQFEKIVFFDADILILKNVDHLFSKPHLTAALDGEYFNIWDGNPHFNSGCMVIEPSKQIFKNLMNFIENIDLENLPYQVIANQEILNLYYNDWVNKTELHLNKYYNIFPPYILDEHLEDIKENAQFLHFVGRKPWNFWIRNPDEIYTEYFYDLGKKILNNISNKLNWDKIKKKNVLTVYGICKNEIKNVQNYLNSFKEADYVCLLDTGSTDGTWEFLLEAKKTIPNLIIDQKVITPWRFDTARNLSMTLIPKETSIFFMADLDEVIKEPGWSKVVKDAWEPNFSRGQYTYNREVGINDHILKQIKEFRIHSKKWNHWQNIVHEALISESGEKQFYIELSTPIDITVWHYPTKTGKTNYMELCEKDLKEYPDDWVMRLQLAIEYEILDNLEKAAYHFQYIIEHINSLQSFEIARCYFGLGRIEILKEDLSKALFYFAEGRLIDPNFVDNYFGAAEIYYNKQCYKEAIELCKLGFKYGNPSYWCSVFDIQSYYSYWLLGMSYLLNNDIEHALSYIIIAHHKNNNEEMNKLKQQVISEFIGRIDSKTFFN